MKVKISVVRRVAFSATALLALVATAYGQPAPAPTAKTLGPGFIRADATNQSASLSAPEAGSPQPAPIGLIAPKMPTVAANRATALDSPTVRASSLSTALAPASLDELARALKYDPDLIYEYVRNNIAFYPILGVHKGALGAAIDNQGTSFDQALLMTELLRRSGIAADVVKGEITISGDEAAAWLGIDNTIGCGFARIFLSGRLVVPGSAGLAGNGTCPTSTSPLGRIGLYHAWVRATLNGKSYDFDPSFKPSVRRGTVDLTAVTGYSGASLMSTARTGATVNSNFIQKANRDGIRTALTGYATKLATHLRTKLPNATLEDVIGEVDITPKTAGSVRQAALPYLADGVTPQVMSDAALNGFRPSVKITVANSDGKTSAGISKPYASDYLYGKRLVLGFDASNRVVLTLNGATEVVGNVVDMAKPLVVSFEISHAGYPIPLTQVVPGQTIKPGKGSFYLIANGWGPMGRGMLEYYRTQLDEATASGAAPESEAMVGPALGLLSATWIAQRDTTMRMLDRIGKVYSLSHHAVGIAGFNRSSNASLAGDAYVDLPGNVIASTSELNDLAAEEAVFYAAGMHASAFESTAVRQTMGVSAVSTVRLLDMAVAAGHPVYNATSANYAASVRPNLLGCNPALFKTFDDLITLKRRLILPGRCDLAENSWKGVGFFDLNAGVDDSFNAMISGGLFGGFGTIKQTPAQITSTSLQSQPSPLGSLLPFTGFSFGDPIDMTKGHYLYTHQDIVVGNGGFPYSLSFERSYNSGSRLNNGVLGRGWSHNLIGTSAVGSDGFQAMGEDSALDAVTSLVELMVSFDLLKDAAQPLDKLVAATLTSQWFVDQFVDNTVIIRQGMNSEVFVRLPDGSYNPPPGSPAKLTKTGADSYTYETVNRGVLEFSAGKLNSFALKSGVKAKFSYTGNELTKVENSLGRVLNLVYTNGKLSSVNDGTGRSVGYTINASTGNLDTYRDSLSYSTQYTYVQPGQMKSIFYPSRPTSAFMVNEYDSLGRVKTQTDANGKKYEYFFAGSRSEEKRPAGGGSHVSYVDGAGRILRAIDPEGRETQHQYDGAGRKRKTIAPGGNTIEYEYDDATCASTELRCTHNVTTATVKAKPGSPLPALVTKTVYEATFNKPQKVTDPRGKVTDYTHHAASGEVETVTSPPDADGVRPVTTFGYTAYSSALSSFYLPTSETRKISASVSVTDTQTYDATKKFVRDTLTVDSDGLQLKTSFSYDAVGNPQTVDGPRSDVTDTATFGYDSERRQTSVTNALGKLNKIFYDQEGRPIRAAAQVGSSWMVSCTRYTPTGKAERNWGPALTTSDSLCPGEAAPVAIVDYAYDELDRVRTVTQQLPAAEGGNRVTQTEYFNDDQVKSLQRGVGSALAQTYAAYTYTSTGLPETVTDARGYTTTFEYDGFDRRSKLRYPDKTKVGSSSTTDFESYGYNENGLVTTLRRRNGQSIAMGYDNLDRPTSRTYPSAADNVSYTYDLLGRRKTADLSGHAISYDWDKAGRLKTTTAAGRTLSYEYDAAGNRERITWPDGYFVSTAYDALNRPTTIKESGTTLLADYSNYDDLSRRKTVSFGNATSTGYGYSSRGALESIAHDLAGSANDVSFSFLHNQASEISTRSLSNSRYSWTPTKTASTTVDYNGLNQLTTIKRAGFADQAVAHDSNGNVQGEGNVVFGYDSDNKLRTSQETLAGGVAARNATLSYDAEGRLVKEDGGPTPATKRVTQFLYDGSDLVAEYDAAGTLLRRYVHGPGVDEPLVALSYGSTGSSKEWVYADQLGSVVATANASGEPTSQQGYGAYGEPNQTGGLRFKYTGQTYMPNVGLYYYKARFYSAELGRFIQADPIGYDDGLNIYSYVKNSPLNFVDSSGLVASDAQKLAGKFIGAVDALTVGGYAGLATQNFQAGNYWTSALNFVSGVGYGAMNLLLAGEASNVSSTVKIGLTKFEVQSLMAVNAARNAAGLNTTATAGVTSATVTSDFRVVIGYSTQSGGPGMATNAVVAAHGATAPVRSRYHLQCGEIHCFSQLLNDRVEAAGAVVASVRTTTGKIVDACDTCRWVAGQLGVKIVNKPVPRPGP